MGRSIDYEKNILYQLQGLTEEALVEVFHFVLFIKKRPLLLEKGLEGENYLFLSEDLREMSMAECEHLEEEFKDYQNIYPVEEVRN